MDFNELASFRQELHRFPELSGNEQETAARVVQFLSDLKGWGCAEGVGGHGVLAHFDSGKPGVHTVFRSELDALPIQERTTVDHKSVNDGVGHHCGHDGHTSILCGLAQQVAENPITSGKITLLFQPAEETGQGAQAMLEDEHLRTLKPDHFIALHNIPGEPLGTILVRPGTMLVASTGVQVTFTGETSHAAEPENGKNPWQAIRTLSDDILSMGSFDMPLAEPAKVTLVGLHLGGPHYGTSPADCVAWFTLRAYKTDILQRMKDIARQRAEALAEIYGLTCDVSFHEHFDATVNADELVDVLQNIATSNGLPMRDLTHPYSYSEDFGRFTSVAPSLFFGLGSGIHQPALHSNQFDFPDELIEHGVTIFDLLTRHFHQ